MLKFQLIFFIFKRFGVRGDGQIKPMVRRDRTEVSARTGPVVLKLKGKSWILILFGIKRLKKNGKVGRNWLNFGPRSSKPVQKNAEDRHG